MTQSKTYLGILYYQGGEEKEVVRSFTSQIVGVFKRSNADNLNIFEKKPGGGYSTHSIHRKMEGKIFSDYLQNDVTDKLKWTRQ